GRDGRPRQGFSARRRTGWHRDWHGGGPNGSRGATRSQTRSDNVGRSTQGSLCPHEEGMGVTAEGEAEAIDNDRVLANAERTHEYMSPERPTVAEWSPTLQGGAPCHPPDSPSPPGSEICWPACVASWGWEVMASRSIPMPVFARPGPADQAAGVPLSLWKNPT